MTNKRQQPLSHHLLNGLTVVIAVAWLIPLFFTGLMSIRPESQPITTGNIFFGCALNERQMGQLPPETMLDFGGCVVTLYNYQQAWQLAGWPQHYLNSIIFVAGTLAVQVVTITLAGYAFARMAFFGRDVLLFVILIQLMIPTGVLIVQNFATVRNLGLFDTHLALMVPYWGSAFGVLLMRQAFREIPIELEEAARIDGANLIAVLRHVYIPLALPTYIAFALVSISAHWNEFLWPFIITRSESVRPLTVALNKLLLTTEVGALYGQLMAGTVLVIAPLVALFMLFQRRFIESFASSGVK